jgi:hypothetical protein
MLFDYNINGYTQIATVEGAIRDCGDIDFPGIYVRLDHPSVFQFIEENLTPPSKFLKFCNLLQFKKNKSWDE